MRKAPGKMSSPALCAPCVTQLRFLQQICHANYSLAPLRTLIGQLKDIEMAIT
jgi:hypothetical protein